MPRPRSTGAFLGFARTWCCAVAALAPAFARLSRKSSRAITGRAHGAVPVGARRLTKGVVQMHRRLDDQTEAVHGVDVLAGRKNVFDDAAHRQLPRQLRLRL